MSRKAILLVLLLGQLLAAFALRWHLTTATLKTEFDYLLAHEVMAGENWRRDGAFARHFIPSRSIDQTLPEWTYRDDYWRDYLSQPPLSYMLQYGTMEAVPAADPVVAGKILAQVQIAAGILAAGLLLPDVFGVVATLAGLSFLIWGRPFLVFFVDGYYSTTPAMVCVLLLVAWCLVFFKKVAAGSPAPIRARDHVVAGLLAFAGVFSEWIALFSNAIAVAAFGAIGVVLLVQGSPRARRAFVFAASIATGSAAAVAAMVALYGTKVGFAFFWRQLMSRVDERTAGAGTYGLSRYTGILVDRMLLSWPRDMLILLALMTGVVLAFALAHLRERRADGSRRPDGGLLLLAIVLAFGGPLTYCYRLQDLVAIHWWFSGTWAVAWATTICTFTYVIRSTIHSAVRGAAARALDVTACTAILAGAIVWNLQFADLAAKEGAIAEGTVLTPAIKASHEVYRAIGGALPRDGAPLVVADMPNLFDAYPYATAYLRRPIVRLSASGALVKLGTTEDAVPALLARGGYVYVAYDRSLRACGHPDATPESWRSASSLAFCRVPVTTLTTPAGRVFRDDPTGGTDVFTSWINDIVPPACCNAKALVDLTRLVDSRLRLRPGAAIDAARGSTGNPISKLIGQWQMRLGGTVQAVDPRWSGVSVLGILSDDRRWYLLVVNGSASALPDFHAGVTLTAGGTPLGVMTPYQVRSSDGRTLLPLSLIAVRPPPGSPRRGLTIELLEGGHALTRTTNVTVVDAPPDGTTRRVERDAVVSLSTGCTNPPGPPVDLRVAPTPSDRVGLTWSGAYGGPVSYVLQGGTAPAAMDVTNSDLGDTGTTFEASRVPPGTYYLRVRGRNACGDGPPSNEVTAVVR